METRDKERQERQLSPAERRRRMEARKKRRKKQRRKKQMIRLLVILAMIAVVILLVFGIYAIVKKVAGGGSKQIQPKGEHAVIYIDPGHGGEDIGLGSDTLEKEVSLAICSKLKIMLEGQGYEVVMTREDDTRVSKEERVAAANDSGADLLVSVHCGSSEDSSRAGAVSYYKTSSKESKTLCKNIQEALVKESGAQDGGTAEGDYTILSTDIPSVLLEVGYLSNTVEAENLADDSYQNNIAKGIAKGIILSIEDK